MKKSKYLIIGAGISGISFANFIKKNYIVCERDKQIGGYCKTIQKKGFIWDFAGHFLHFRNPEMRQFAEKILQDDVVTVQKRSKIFLKNKFVDYPFQSNFYQLGLKDFLGCFSSLIFRKKKTDYPNYEEMLLGKFGKAICKHFLFPYNKKLYAVDLKKLDSNAMGRFFPYVAIKDVLINLSGFKSKTFYNDSFIYPKKGIFQFVKKLGKKVDNIVLNNKLIEVNIKSKIAKFEKGYIKYDYLISTMPFNNFYNLIQTQVKNKVGDLSYNKVLVFNFGFKNPTKIKCHWIYIPEEKFLFYRVGFYNNILSQKKMSLYVEIGFKKDEVIDVTKIRKKVLKDLREIIGNNEIVAEHHVLMDPAYVHLEIEKNKKINKLKKELNKHNIYLLGRYAEWGYFSMEDCMIHAKQLAERLTK